MIRRRLAAVLLGIAIGWMANEFCAPAHNRRPVLSFIARAARVALWWFAFAEPPQHCPPIQSNGVGPDGYASLSHGDSI